MSIRGEESPPARGLFSLSNSPLLRALATRPVQVGFVLALLTCAAFAPACGYGYVNFDDPYYVEHNFDVHGGLTWNGIVWSFTTLHAGNWHPLTWLSLQMDAELFGGTAASFHRTNLILHVFNVLLLYALLTRMTANWPAAALTAALFAVHPLRVESVVWITERKDVLSTFFGLLAIAAYLRYAHRPSVSRYALVLLAYVASLLAKPMLVTLPCLLLLLDWWPLRRWQMGQLAACADPQPPFPPIPLRLLFAEKLPLLVLALAAAAVTVYAQNQGGAVKSLEHFPLSLRLANALDSTVLYLRQTLWPMDLAVYYPFPRAGVLSWRLAIDGVLLFCLTALAIWWARSRPYLLVGWLWYLGTLVPVVGLVQVGQQAHADRYTYIPQIGLLVAIVWGLSDLLPRRRRLLGFGVVALLVLPLFMLMTYRQTGYWESSLALWKHTLEVTDENPLARTNYAHALLAARREDEAVEQLQEALRIYPEMDPALELLGGIHERHGRREQALACFRAALAIRPDQVRYRDRVEKLEKLPEKE